MFVACIDLRACNVIFIVTMHHDYSVLYDIILHFVHSLSILLHSFVFVDNFPKQSSIGIPQYLEIRWPVLFRMNYVILSQ